MEKTSIMKFLVQDRASGEFDTEILHRKIFDVNMRLFQSSSTYRNIVLEIVKYMGKVVSIGFSDYVEASGISGANVGIPFNIIGVRATKDMIIENEAVIKNSFFFMINPEIVEKSNETRVVSSNCGSLRLSDKIRVKRHKEVNVSFYNLTGSKKTASFSGSMSCTIQHEIDHNLGILITDKEEKE